MLAITRMIQLCTTLAFLFAFALAGEKTADEIYDPSAEYDPTNNYRPRNITGLGDFYSWVGSYYNATAEVELEFLFGWQYGEPLCPVWNNYTHTAKFDAVLSILERGHWNGGNNSVIFWLALLPQNSPQFNVSSLTYRDMTDGRDFGISYPIISTSLFEHRHYRPGNRIISRPGNGSSVDTFDFITSQVSKGVYNLSSSVGPDNQPESGWSTFANFSNMPVCDSTTQTHDTRLHMMEDPGWDGEDWNDFQYPHTSIQFDDETANLTLDGTFYSAPYIHPNQTSGGPTAHGFLRVRFSGVLDRYHSDTLIPNGKTPTWLRTVGFSNDSSNIGYSENSESLAAKSNLRLAFTFTTSIISVSMVLL